MLIDINRAFVGSICAELRALNGPSANGVSGAEDARRLGLYVLYAWYAHAPAADAPLAERLADAVLFRVGAAMAALPERWADAANTRSSAAVLIPRAFAATCIPANWASDSFVPRWQRNVPLSGSDGRRR